jgi:hypothetical protein
MPRPASCSFTRGLVSASILALGLVLRPSPAHTAAVTPDALARGIEFSVLSYNVAGLPRALGYGNPERRLPEIGRLLRRYDVALLQETFANLRLLKRAAAHPLVKRGNGPRAFWGRFLSLFCGRCGSGLSSLAGADEKGLVEVHKGAYSHCSGWVRPWIDRSDCWASKGWLHMRLDLGAGEPVDVYNTHLEAGRGHRDQDVRRLQLEELVRAIELQSGGRPVIVGGDFNLALERGEDAAQLRRFRERLGLRDTGAHRENRTRWRNRIDHIFFRSGDVLRLVVRAAGEAHEFIADGAPLSDHPAVFARFRTVRSD